VYSKNPAPAEVGLMGVLPGITGTMMANEVIKIITGTGLVLSGKILVFNVSDYSFHTINIENIPENHNISELKSEY
jgi:adenylyltransferase/sulfurtransferase